MRVTGLEEVGERAVLVRVEDTAAALSLALHLRRELAGVVDDVVPAARTVLVDGLGEVGSVREAVDRWVPTASPGVGRSVRIPVEYDGADLAALARHWGVSQREVVRRHTSTLFTSAFCGFAPGFAYLSGSTWPVPRLPSPRATVPAGSVALADTWCGVYPRSSPGGWHLLGHTEVAVWDLAADPPALLAPGTRVRFEAVR